MNRSYVHWRTDAHSSYKSITQLGNELRDRWDDWKVEAPYVSWEECLLKELGITADALRKRNERTRTQVAVTKRHADPSPPASQPKRTNQRQSTSEERERRRAIVGRLWDEGYSYGSIRDGLDISAGALAEDLKTLGLTEKRHPLGVMSIPIPPSRDLRWKEEDLPEPKQTVTPKLTPEESKTLRVPAGACAIAPAGQRIVGIQQALDDLLDGDIYALSLKDRNRLLSILQKALERLTNNDQNAAEAVRRTG